MFKPKATLIPGRVRDKLFIVPGFRGVQQLGPEVRLADELTGRPQKLVCFFARPKNHGVLIVLTNAIPDLQREMAIPPEASSAVHFAAFNRPEEVVGLVEAFVDTLQDCYIYEDLDEENLHKDTLMTHILNNETACITI